jgi:CheY-like chemotaxis protein
VRILWVDDNPANNSVLTATYRAKGVQFDLALSTEEALQFLGNAPEAYALIISDMGRGNEHDAGNRLLAHIKEKYPSAPPVVIYCHPRAAKAYGEKAKELGAADVTSSPKEAAYWIDKTLADRAGSAATVP